MLFDELVKLEQEQGLILANSPTQTVGYEVVSQLKKVTHNHPLLSLGKTTEIQEFYDYFKGLPMLLMAKMDGLTCSLLYRDGKLVRAESRGDGETGEDITHNAKVIVNLPLEIPFKGEMIIDGECIITRHDFERINKPLVEKAEKEATAAGLTGKDFKEYVRKHSYANPRNLVSGSVRQLDSGVAAKRNIRFIGWKLHSMKNPDGTPYGVKEHTEGLIHLEKCGFEVVSNVQSTRKLYFKGQATIPSDTVCYPAKLVHGHISDLLEKNIDFIFYPCMSYNIEEPDTDTHYNCPVVAYYPELLKANIPELNDSNFKNPYIDPNRKEHVAAVMADLLKEYGISRKQTLAALESGFEALMKFRKDVSSEALRIIARAREEGKKIIVLAGRPYHIDKEINHGINKLITSLGMAVVTEDSICELGNMPDLDVLNQWTYHSRMYRAAEYVTRNDDMQLVQLVSFGCGIDAVTTDEVRAILEKRGKLYTQLKIDEISNLGAAKIRLRSLMAASE